MWCFHGIIANHNYVKYGSSAGKEFHVHKIAEVICGNHEVVTSSSDEYGKPMVAQLFALSNKVMFDLKVGDAQIST